jgi:geranylgeranyl diphosphate synthase type 3
LIEAFNVWIQVEDEEAGEGGAEKRARGGGESGSPWLSSLVEAAGGETGSTVAIIQAIVGALHSASLLVDDIEDSSPLRRGSPAAHAIYGVPSTLNSANYVYFLALDAIGRLPAARRDPELMAAAVSEMLNLHRGQGFDIYWRDSSTVPTLEQYKAMVIDKTGGLLRLAVTLMVAHSKCTKDFEPLLQSFGLYYQIRDDYINLVSEKYAKAKTFAEDLTEGKFSFPIIHAIRANEEDTRILSILRQRSSDEHVKRHAVQYLRQVGSLDATRAVLDELEAEIAAHIEALGGNEKLTRIVEYLKADARE